MPKRQSNPVARTRLDEAIVELLGHAKGYDGNINPSCNTVNVLRAAREYARALNRVETLRRSR
jgi:hypothetical protein